MTTRIVVAIPCHRDEPNVGATVDSLASSAEAISDGEVRIVVCINGRDPGSGPAAGSLAGSSTRCSVRLLDVASKPTAWNVLRAEPADIHVFADADIRVEPDTVASLLRALANPQVVAAAGVQLHEGRGVVARVARVPHRLAWGGLLGTLYAARTESLPALMPVDIVLDDGWLFATLGHDRVVRARDAVATVQLPARWRDLWRQRVRAERGKAQLKRLGLPLAPSPPEASPLRVWSSYPKREWPYVAALAAIKAAAAVRARFGQPRWDLADSTKR